MKFIIILLLYKIFYNNLQNVLLIYLLFFADIALALHDQELVNNMQELPKCVRRTFCNKMTRRFPPLPLRIRGCVHKGAYINTQDDQSDNSQFSNSITDEEDETLTPGWLFLSLP